MLKIWIERDLCTDRYGIYIGEKRGDKLFMATPVKLIMTEVKGYEPFKGTKVKPFLKIDGLFGHDLLHELLQALSKFGIKDIKREEELESVLKVKDYHLEDMRKLVFKEKK